MVVDAKYEHEYSVPSPVPRLGILGRITCSPVTSFSSIILSQSQLPVPAQLRLGTKLLGPLEFDLRLGFQHLEKMSTSADPFFDGPNDNATRPSLRRRIHSELGHASDATNARLAAPENSNGGDMTRYALALEDYTVLSGLT